MNLSLFSTVFCTSVIAISVFSPVFATQGIVFLTYFRPMERIPLQYPITFVMLVLCMIILLFYKKPYKYSFFSESRRDSLLVIIMQLYLLVNIIIFNRWSMVELYRTYVIPALIVYFMISEFITTTKHLKYLFMVLVGSSLIICLDSLSVHFNVEQGLEAWSLYHVGHEERLINIGWWDNPNKIGFLFNVGILSCIILASLTSSNILRLIYLLPIIFYVPAIVLTGSRAALLQLGVSGGLFIFQSRKQIIILMVVTAVIVVAFNFLEGLAPERIYGEGSRVLRMDLLYFAKDVFISHPFLGVGFKLFREYNPYRQVLHNTYLQVFTELGLVGAVLLFTMMIKILKGCLRTIRLTKDKMGYEDIHLVSKEIFALSIGCFVYFLFGNQLLDFMFFTIMGLLVAVKRIYDVKTFSETHL